MVPNELQAFSWRMKIIWMENPEILEEFQHEDQAIGGDQESGRIWIPLKKIKKYDEVNILHFYNINCE